MMSKSTTLEECYNVARSEAERYQGLINKLENSADSKRDLDILTAKRNAASRIARLIRHGAETVVEQEQHEQAQQKPKNLIYERRRAER